MKFTNILKAFKKLKLKTLFTLVSFFFIFIKSICPSSSISNKNFSLGSYGRVAIAKSLGPTNSDYPQSLNLNGMGSIGGRFEENGYSALVPKAEPKIGDNI